MAKQHRKEKSIWPSFNLLRESTMDRARLAADAEAKLRSESIDRALEDERKQLSREPKAKILLLGPSESGKSTLVKGLQMAFSPAAFYTQMNAWLPIIHLNLVRALNAILEVLETLETHSPGDTPIPPAEPSQTDGVPREVSGLIGRLQRLRLIEQELELDVHPSEPSSLISSPAFTRPSTPVHSSASHPASEQHELPPRRRNITHRASEISMRPDILKQRLMDHHVSGAAGGSSHHQFQDLLAEHSSDMCTLWEHPWIRKALEDRDIRLEFQSGFFLNAIPRLTSPSYRPTTEDVLRARVHTHSAEEHRLILEDQPSAREKEWIIYDVCGGRGQRAAWAQYFEDVTLVVYVASLSAFDETLAEDPSVNRLTDSLLLWQTLCSNKLLASVDFVLLLNKVDLLESKLKGDEGPHGKPGANFVDYVNSFKSRTNDTDTVAAYIREMYLNLHRQHSPPTRKVHSHITCAIDPLKTRPIFDSIRNVVVARMATGNGSGLV